MPIKPALTAEEWSLAPKLEEMTNCFVLTAVGVNPTFPNLRIERHGAAALCLHNQSFGFSREDIAAIRLIIDAIPNPEIWDSRWRNIVSLGRSLADRIEALLPPAISSSGETKSPQNPVSGGGGK